MYSVTLDANAEVNAVVFRMGQDAMLTGGLGELGEYTIPAIPIHIVASSPTVNPVIAPFLGRL